MASRKASFLRTISGRIVLGFVVLQTTFGVVAGYSIWQMNRLGSRLRFVRTTYLDTVPDVAWLQVTTDGVNDMLEQAQPSRARLLKNRDLRNTRFVEVQQKFEALHDVPPALVEEVASMRKQVASLATLHAANETLFREAFPTERNTPEAKAALQRLAKNEKSLAIQIRGFQDYLQKQARFYTEQVERHERYSRYWSLALGAVASFVALLVTIWAVLTLRPLRRLADGARRVASGDYRGRVEASGGTEVAELASEFNAMAAAIEEREQELVRSERLAAVGKMAAVITHEVRNPLSSIGLNAELLDEELGKIAAGTASPREAQQLLASVQKEVDRLTAITEEYLRFARLPRPRLEKEQLNDIASGLVEFQREELLQRGVTVEATLAPGLPVIAADEAQIRQALLNLVRNAADAMTGKGGKLSVTTRRTDAGAVEVRVADQGPGIASENLAKIFEPFFSTKDGGTGLGLALTQQIVLEHGGKIHVESSGAGSTFVIELPAAS